MPTAPAPPLRFAFAGMIAMVVAMGIGRFVYTPILPGMMDELGLSASQAGFIASANYLGYLAGAVLAAGGWAHGRERAVMFAALLLTAALTGAMALTESVAVFSAVRFLSGLSTAFVMVFITTIVFSHLAAAGREELQAVHFAGVGIGITLSGAMTGLLYLAGSGWAAGWSWSAVVSAAGCAVVLLLLDRGPAGTGSAEREPPLPDDPALRRVILAYGIFGFGYIITATFLIAIVREGEAGHLAESAVWMAAGLAGIPSIWLWGLAARRWGLTTIFAAGTLVEAVGVFASVSLGGFLGPLLGGALLGGTFIAVTAIGLQLGRRLAGRSPRRALAFMTAAFGTGQILGPIFAGYLTDLTGTYFLASVGAALALLASAFIAWQTGRSRPV